MREVRHKSPRSRPSTRENMQRKARANRETNQQPRANAFRMKKLFYVSIIYRMAPLIDFNYENQSCKNLKGFHFVNLWLKPNRLLPENIHYRPKQTSLFFFCMHITEPKAMLPTPSNTERKKKVCKGWDSNPRVRTHTDLNRTPWTWLGHLCIIVLGLWEVQTIYRPCECQELNGYESVCGSFKVYESLMKHCFLLLDW